MTSAREKISRVLLLCSTLESSAISISGRTSSINYRDLIKKTCTHQTVQLHYEDLQKKTSSCHQKLSSAALVNFTRNRRHIPAPTKRKPTVGAPRHRSRSFSSWSVVLLFFPIFFSNFSFFGAWVSRAPQAAAAELWGARALWECDVRPLSQTFHRGW